jgi:Flp pilus assembly protein TadB
MELMETAETVEDMITVEERLSEVRYQLESMESQLRTYDNQIDYSKVELYINEVERYTPVQEKSAWDRIRTGFTENVYRVTKGIKNFCIEFVIALPILIVWALVIFVVIMLLRWIRSRRKAGKHRMFGKKTEDTTSGKEENGEQQPKL